MYEVYLTNFHMKLENSFEKLSEAIAYGKSKGYEFSVHDTEIEQTVGYASGVSLQWHDMMSELVYDCEA